MGVAAASAVIAVCCLGGPSAAEALNGRVIDAKSGQAIASAEVMIVGLAGSVRTDADGLARSNIRSGPEC